MSGLNTKDRNALKAKIVHLNVFHNNSTVVYTFVIPERNQHAQIIPKRTAQSGPFQ